MSTQQQPTFWRTCLATGVQTFITVTLFMLAGMHLLLQYAQHPTFVLMLLIALSATSWLMAKRTMSLKIAAHLSRYQPWALIFIIGGIIGAYALNANAIALGLTTLWGLLIIIQTTNKQSQLISHFGMPHITRLYAWRSLSIAIGLVLTCTIALVLQSRWLHISPLSLHTLTWSTCLSLIICQAIISMPLSKPINDTPPQHSAHTPLITNLSLALSVSWLIIISVIGITFITHPHAHQPTSLMIMGITSAIGFLCGCVYMLLSSRSFVDLINLSVTPVFIAASLIALHALQSTAGMSIALFILGLFTAPHLITLKSNIASDASHDVRCARLVSQHSLTVFTLTITLIALVITHILGLSLSMQSILLCLLAVIGAMMSLNALPQHLMRFLLSLCNRLYYRINTIGVENIPKTGAAISVANHTSGIDWGLIQSGSSRTMRMVINQTAFKIWYLNHFFRWIKLIPINRNQPSKGMKAIQQALEEGDMVCIFAEGHLSPNGQLNPLYSGFERIVQQTPCPIIPVYTHGLWRGPRSLAPARSHRPAALRNRNITVCFGPALPSTTQTAEATQAINALAYPAWQQYSLTLNHVACHWLTTALRCRELPCLAEKLNPSLSHNDVIARVWHACHHLTTITTEPTRIAIMLPTSIDSVIAHLACWCRGHTVININPHHPEQIAELSNTPTLISSTTYHQSLSRQGITITANATTMLNTDDWHTPLMQKRMRKLTKRIKRMSPWRIKHHLLPKQRTPRAAIEVLPSTNANTRITLTHRQLLTQTEQLASVLNLTDSDVILASQPLHDGMGLVSSLLLPLVEGCPALLHPDTQHINQLGKYLHQRRVSVMITTPDHLDAYAKSKKMLPAMLSHLRLVICTHTQASTKIEDSSTPFTNKFNVPVYHGYAIPQHAAMISCNLPDVLNTQAWRMKPFSKHNSVGMTVPGNRVCVTAPHTLTPQPLGTAGDLWVKLPGTNHAIDAINLSTHDQPDPSIDWIQTGITASVDERGFVSLTPVTLPTNEPSMVSEK